MTEAGACRLAMTEAGACRLAERTALLLCIVVRLGSHVILF